MVVITSIANKDVWTLSFNFDTEIGVYKLILKVLIKFLLTGSKLDTAVGEIV